MKNELFIKIILALKDCSKCISKQVGAILVKEGRVISTGYNGTLSGAPNCCDKFNPEWDKNQHHEWSLLNEIHAEQNAIAMAAKHGIALDGCDCYTTLQPCNTCLLLLVQSGIKNIFYLEEYERCSYSEDLLKIIQERGIRIEKIEQ